MEQETGQPPATAGSAAGAFDIEHLARLARIELGDAEKARLAAELETVVRHFDALKRVDVTGVEPSAHAFPVFCGPRDDTADAAGLLDAGALGEIAPVFRDGQVLVPRVVDDGG